jgi:hypothetical protein
MSILPMNQDLEIKGTVHVLIAFDWGDQVDLELAKHLVRAEEHKLLRRSRTPSSIAYKPSPLIISLDEVLLELPEIGSLTSIADATVFDFAGVSVDLKIPFSLKPDRLLSLAGYLAEGDPLVSVARSSLDPMYRKLRPAIQQPLWSSLSEDYFVFLISPDPSLPSPATLLDLNADWLAGLVRMETGALSGEEIAEAVKLHLIYSPNDLFVPDWAAAVLIDRDCEETLQTIEFVNLLLLEFRHLDERLAIRLAEAHKLIQPLVRARLPLLHTHHRSLRSLGELRMEANSMIERPANVLKLLGDQYIARVYSLLARRFHLEEWEQSIRRTLEVIEGAYGVISDQAATYRTEILEIIVILLILIEIIMAITRH